MLGWGGVLRWGWCVKVGMACQDGGGVLTQFSYNQNLFKLLTVRVECHLLHLIPLIATSGRTTLNQSCPRHLEIKI